MLSWTRRLAPCAVLLPIAGALPALAESSQKRMQALDALVSAYAAYRGGKEPEGRAGVEKALALDPELAYANIVRGEVALKEQDWLTAQKYFERGLTLLKQPDQPVAPRGVKTPVSDVEGDAQCFLGYVYIKRPSPAPAATSAAGASGRPATARCSRSPRACPRASRAGARVEELDRRHGPILARPSSPR